MVTAGPVEGTPRVVVVSDDPRANALCDAINRIAPLMAVLRTPENLTVEDVKHTILVVDAGSRPPPPEVNNLLTDRLYGTEGKLTLVLETGRRDSLRPGRLPRELLSAADTGARLLSMALLSELEPKQPPLRKERPGASRPPSTPSQPVPRSGASQRLRSLGQLAATVAHEVNNPATFVMTNAETIRENLALAYDLIDSDPNAAKEMIHECNAILGETRIGLDRITDIVATLRTFGRVESEPVRRLDIRDVVNDAVTIVRADITAVARLSLDLVPLPLIAASRGKLAQVLANLLINSVHAIVPGDPEKNEIRIRTYRDHGEVVLRVEDTGCGIDGELLPKIFQPFFTTKPNDQGTGLGLALSAQTVREHGGRILAESVVGEGTSVEVRLPEHTGLRVRLTPERPIERPSKKRARVLIVDDEPMILRAFRRLLAREHEILVAESGAQAIELLKQGNEVDAIICDLMMHDLDGAGVHHWIGEHRPELTDRVLFVSGGAYTVRLREFIRDIENEVLDKPISAAALRHALDRVLVLH